MKQKFKTFLHYFFNYCLGIVFVLIIFTGNIFLSLPEQVQSQTRVYATIYDYVEESDLYEIQGKLQTIPHVENVVFSSKENELKKLLEYYDDDGTLAKMYSGENNPLQNTFEIEVDEVNEAVIKGVITNVYEISDVDQVKSNYESVANVLERVYTVNFFVYGVYAVVLLVLIVRLIIQIFKKKYELKEYSRSILKEIAITILLFALVCLVESLGYNRIFSLVAIQMETAGISLPSISSQIPMIVIWMPIFAILLGITNGIKRKNNEEKREHSMSWE